MEGAQKHKRQNTEKKVQKQKPLLKDSSGSSPTKLNLSEEQKKIAREIREFIQRERTLKTYSTQRTGKSRRSGDHRRTRASKSTTSASFSSPKPRQFGSPGVCAESPLAYSTRSMLSLTIPTLERSFSSFNSSRSSPSLPANLNGSDFQFPPAPVGFVQKPEDESEQVPDTLEDAARFFAKDFFSDTGLGENSALPVNKIMEQDKILINTQRVAEMDPLRVDHALEEADCPFSDYYSDATSENEDDSPRNKSHKSRLLPGLLPKARGRRRRPRRHSLASVAVGGLSIRLKGAKTSDDFANLLGASILDRHG